MTVSAPRPQPVVAEVADLIEAELQRFGSLRPKRVGTAWDLLLGEKRCRVALTADWLVFDSPAPRNRPRRASRLLGRNAELRGNVRYIVPSVGVVRLRNDVPIREPSRPGIVRLGRDIPRAVSDLAAALDMAAPERVSSSARGGAAAPGPELANGETALPDLGAEAGWPFTERANGGLSVDLEVGGGGAFTAVVSRAGGTIALKADLIRGEAPADETCAEAVAALLLCGTAEVRLVAAIGPPPAAEGAAGGTGFRVRLPVDATGEDLEHGLSAISVASEMCGREVRALARDPELAGLYLDACHPHWLAKRRRSPRSKTFTTT